MISVRFGFGRGMIIAACLSRRIEMRFLSVAVHRISCFVLSVSSEKHSFLLVRSILSRAIVVVGTVSRMLTKVSMLARLVYVWPTASAMPHRMALWLFVVQSTYTLGLLEFSQCVLPLPGAAISSLIISLII